MVSEMKATELGGSLSMPGASEDNVTGYYIPSKAKNLEQLLKNTTVDQLLASYGNIHSVLDTDTVETALQAFRDNNVQSVPVYSSKNENKFMGMVDNKDIIDYFFSLSKEQLLTTFMNTKIGNLIELSKLEDTPMLSVGTPLLDVILTLSKGDNHRIGVRDPSSNALFNIISQMSLVKFIARNVSLLDKDLKDSKVSSFMKQFVTIENIPADTTTVAAFNYLFRRNISAAAIVDANGIVVDTLSVSDLVGFLYDEKFSHLEDPITTFLSSTRRTKSVKPPIVCTMEDSFEYVLLKLASTRVHRLWIVATDANTYLGFVNLTNVLAHSVAQWIE